MSPFPSAAPKLQFLAHFLLLCLLLTNYCSCVFPLEFSMDEWPQEETAGFLLADQVPATRVRKLIRPPPLKRSAAAAAVAGGGRAWRIVPIPNGGWKRRNAVLMGRLLF
jgi:hypothetical protein